MSGPAVIGVVDVARRALEALDGEGQVLAVAEGDATTVTVTAVHAGRAAAASTTQTTDQALARTAKRAAVQARRMRALPAPPLPPPRPGMTGSAWTSVTGPEPTVPQGFRLEHDRGTADVAVLSTTGVIAVERRSHAIARVSAERGARRATAVLAASDAVDVDRVVAEVRALLGDGDAVGPFSPHVPAGDPVGLEDDDLACLVLGPEAVAVLLDRLRPAFGIDLALGAAPLADVSPAITLTDDAQHAETLPRAIDVEGVPRQAVTLIERGVARGGVRDGARSTGHATRPLTTAPMPENLLLGPGDAPDVEALIAPVARGLFVPALVRPGTTVGAAAIAGGRLAGPVAPLELDLDPAEVLRHTEALTAPRRIVALRGHAPGGPGAATVPALRTRIAR